MSTLRSVLLTVGVALLLLKGDVLDAANTNRGGEKNGTEDGNRTEGHGKSPVLNATKRNFNIRTKLFILTTFCVEKDCRRYNCEIKPAIRDLRKCLATISMDSTKQINEKHDLKRRVNEALNAGRETNHGEPGIALAMSAMNGTSLFYDGYINMNAISRDFWEYILGGACSLLYVFVYKCCQCWRRVKGTGDGENGKKEDTVATGSVFPLRLRGNKNSKLKKEKHHVSGFFVNSGKKPESEEKLTKNVWSDDSDDDNGYVKKPKILEMASLHYPPKMAPMNRF